MGEPEQAGEGVDVPDGVVTQASMLIREAVRVMETEPARAIDCIQKAIADARARGERRAEASALDVLSSILEGQGETERALEAAERACEAYAACGAVREQRACLTRIGELQTALGRHGAASVSYDQALVLARQLNDTADVAAILKKCGNVWMVRGEYARARDAYEESLRALKNLNDERGEAGVLNNLGTVYRHLGDYPTALEYLQRSLVIKESLGDSASQASTLNNMGLLYEAMGMYPRAMECYQRSLPIIQQMEDRYREAAVLGNIGVVYQQIGDYSRSLEFFLRSLGITQRIADRAGEAQVLNNIGFVYLESGDSEAALEYLHRSVAIWEELGDTHSEAVTLDSIGGVYYKQRNYEAALENLQKSLAITRSSSDQHYAANTLNDIGNVYQAIGDVEAAYTHYRECLELAEQLGYKHREAEVLLGIGSVYTHQQQYDRAFDALTRALVLAEDLGAKELMYRGHRGLALACERAGNLARALKHLRQFQSIREEVFNEESDKTFKRLQAIHDVETAKQEAEIYRLRNVDLVRLNAELQEVISEKNELLSIAAHDLRNPLTTIVMAASMVANMADTMTMDEISEHMNTIDKTSHRMLEIIHKLLTSERLDSGSMELSIGAVDLVGVARDVHAEYHPRAELKQIALNLHCSEEELTISSDLSAVKQVIDNLLSNAVKYSPSSTTVDVRIRRKASYGRIEVQDEGPGLTDEDKRKLFGKFARLSARPTGDEQSIGLGLSIVKKLVDRMQGRVWCESTVGHGATFVVELPLWQKNGTPVSAAGG